MFVSNIILRLRYEILFVGAQKTIISATKAVAQQQRRPVQQKVINQMVSQRAPGQQARTVVRHVIEPSRPGQGGKQQYLS